MRLFLAIVTTALMAVPNSNASDGPEPDFKSILKMRPDRYLAVYSTLSARPEYCGFKSNEHVEAWWVNWVAEDFIAQRSLFIADEDRKTLRECERNPVPGGFEPKSTSTPPVMLAENRHPYPFYGYGPNGFRDRTPETPPSPQTPHPYPFYGYGPNGFRDRTPETTVSPPNLHPYPYYGYGPGGFRDPAPKPPAKLGFYGR